MALRNRVALITGGTRGIGRGIALRLAKEGARIAIGYRTNKNVAQNTLRQLQAAGADCVAVEADITSCGPFRTVRKYGYRSIWPIGYFGQQRRRFSLGHAGGRFA